MSVICLRGIVLKQEDTGESGRQIVLLAKGEGKVRLSARGARNAKSKLLAGTQMFCYGDFMAYVGKGFYSVTQITLFESFYALRTDVEKLSEAVYLAELVEKTTPEGMAVDDVLEFLLYTLQIIAAGVLPPRLAGRIFEIKLLQLEGFLAEYGCMECGQEAGALYFCEQDASFCCAAHRHGSGFFIPPAVGAAFRHVMGAEGKAAFGFLLSDEALDVLDRVLSIYIAVHTGVHCKSRGFLQQGF